MSLSIPAPSLQENFTECDITTGQVERWYHVYSTRQYPVEAMSFNRGWGATRFAPIRQADGTYVDTYYAASTVECALMESVLHDIPLHSAGQFATASLEHFHLVTLQFAGSLRAVSLHTPYLPMLGLSRAQLIDSLPAYYQQTRAWAQAAYLQRPQAQAIAYGSRRDDAARCLMLFGQRLPVPPFRVIAVESLALGERRQQVWALIKRLGIHRI